MRLISIIRIEFWDKTKYMMRKDRPYEDAFDMLMEKKKKELKETMPSARFSDMFVIDEAEMIESDYNTVNKISLK